MNAPSDPRRRSWDTIVVGAGSSGSVLANRLSEDPARDVLLVEAGPDRDASTFRDPDSLWAADPRAGFATAYDVTLTGTRRATMARGQVIGGSSAINGAYFIRARRHDHDQWARTSELWSHEASLSSYLACERDIDFGTRPGHGTSGPIPVSRLTSDLHPLTHAFVAACRDASFPDEPDKNGDQPGGIGPLPRNVSRGHRVDAATAYLTPDVRARPNLTVLPGTRVLHVLLSGTRAVGVVLAAGAAVESVAGDEVILTAGAIASPHLLLLSGIGPAADLEGVGITPILDLPVGVDFRDHPSIRLPLVPRESVLPEWAPLFEHLLNTQSSDAQGADDLQVMPALRPLPADGSADPLSLLLTLQQSEARGRLRLVSADPDVAPAVDFNYLTEQRDRLRFRDGMHMVRHLCEHRGLSAVARPRGWGGLRSDIDLDNWVRANVGTSIHMSGTCRFGNDPRTSVVDPTGQVHGAMGLRVVDTSILPTAPTRGTAATAAMIGEHVARLLRAGADH